MKKIESAAEIEERRKKRGMYLTILMLIILLGSTAGYSFLSSEKADKNKGNAQGAEELGVKVGEQYVYLAHSKNDTSNVSVNVMFNLQDYAGKKVYVVSENNGISQEIMSTIGGYADGIQNACYGNCTENLPEKNCSDMLIVWQESSENRVYQQDNCVFIEGDMKAVDAFIYRMFE